MIRNWHFYFMNIYEFFYITFSTRENTWLMGICNVTQAPRKYYALDYFEEGTFLQSFFKCVHVGWFVAIKL